MFEPEGANAPIGRYDDWIVMTIERPSIVHSHVDPLLLHTLSHKE